MLSTLQDWTGKWKQLKQWALHRSTGAPADIVEGGIYYDDTEHKPYYNDGITNIQIGGTSDHELLSNLIGGDATGHGHLIPATATKVEAYGQANGMVISDANNYIPISQIPASLLGAVRYQGTWNASTNTPTLAQPPSATTKGYYYITSVAGTFNSVTYNISDWIISDGTDWQKIDNTDAVTSVAGRTGAVVLTKSDVGLGNVDNTSDANKPISTATQTALNAKQNQLTFDTVPTDGSSNPVTSNGVFDALANIQSSTTYPAQAGSVSGAVSYNLLRFAFPYSASYIYTNIIIEISLFASDHPTDMGTMQILLSVSYEGGVFEYTASELYSTVATADRARIAFYDNSPTSKNVYIGFNAPSTNRSFGARIVSNTNPSACSILYYTNSSTMGGDVAILTNKLVNQNSGTYGNGVLVGVKGGYAGLTAAGQKRIVFMSNGTSTGCGLYNETDGKWLMLFDGQTGLVTDYLPVADANTNIFATTGWVLGRLADTKVGNADKVDGYHIVCQSSFPSSPASNTIYFCY